MKKFLSVILALTICFLAVSAAVAENTPKFDNIQFLSTAIKDYKTKYTFSSEVFEYSLNVKTYSTSKITLQNTTAFNDEKYEAFAEYTDVNGVEQKTVISNRKISYINDIPFGDFFVNIVIKEKESDVKTVYKYNFNRPRDTTKTLKSKNGIVIVPKNRNLLKTKINNLPEGEVILTENENTYKAVLLNDINEFSLLIQGATAYSHLRYSLDDGKTFEELEQGGGTTKVTELNDEIKKIIIQVVDDKSYSENGFNAETVTYILLVEHVSDKFEDAAIKSVDTDGYLYPDFESRKSDYVIMAEPSVTEKELFFEVEDNAKVTNLQDEDGKYKINLSKTATNVEVKNGSISNIYSFKLLNKKEGYPDKVVDYLPINSQYTNGVGFGNAASPWLSLTGTYVSIGGFGGYITYYYKDGIKDDDKNKYGIDFYVYGNASKDTSTESKMSFYEPGQCYVSEDGEKWYALAGSAHYDDKVDWNYEITYKKLENGKTAWKDNHENENDGSKFTGDYPLSSIYDISDKDEITIKGICLPAANGEYAVSGVAVDAYPVKWGYVDVQPNGTLGADINPYADNSDFNLTSNGFDLKWAVDENGEKVDVKDKEFHYVKIQTASNIWHPSFGEKSTEVSGVLKTKPQEENVGTSEKIEKIKIVFDEKEKEIELSDDITEIYLENASNVLFKVETENENVYINNERCKEKEITVGKDKEKLVRILAQDGEKEPVIYLIKAFGNAEDKELVKNVKLRVSEKEFLANKDGGKFTYSVGSSIESIKITPELLKGATVKINNDELCENYILKEGENVFNIESRKGEIIYDCTLTVTREKKSSGSGNSINVYFTLLGDENHGDNGEIHTYQNGKLSKWIPKTKITVDSGATVVDVIEKALKNKYTFVNSDGNYISKVDDLAEFSNGGTSGWMYMLNGQYPSKGIKEQKVKNGDSIILHYTDDFTVEQASKKWSSSVRKIKKETKIVLKIGKTDAVVNEKTVKTDVPPIIKNDRTFLPIRFIAENLGAKVEWNGETNEAKITSSDNKIVIILTIGSKIAIVNNKEVEIDVEAFTENDRMFLPVRFVSENLKAEVSWDDKNKEVTIIKK